MQRRKNAFCGALVLYKIVTMRSTWRWERSGPFAPRLPSTQQQFTIGDHSRWFLWMKYCLLVNIASSGPRRTACSLERITWAPNRASLVDNHFDCADFIAYVYSNMFILGRLLILYLVKRNLSLPVRDIRLSRTTEGKPFLVRPMCSNSIL